DPKDAVDIGRSILVGVALDQLRMRSRPILIGLAAAALVGVVGVFVTDGVVQVMLGLVVAVALVAAVIVLGLRFLAGRILRAIAPPTEIADHREAIQDAIEQLALPTGPVSGLRFAWGLRDGIDAELENATDVITTLRERLDV
ncbi:MAG: hypothetical protein AAGC53_09050, partial [Actinomycetota bacterium]